jgi:beta-glucanase (GH16 family)
MYSQFKNIIHLLLFVLVFSSCQSDRQLVWEENFNGNSLNEEYWSFELGDGCPDLCGWGNNELQLYTKKNHQVQDGLLTITSKLENGKYTSTRLTTKNKQEFQYGKMEMKAKLPIGKGLWPAFWMLGSNKDEVGWPLCGEIDILEYVGREPETIFTTLHTADSHGNSKNTKKDKIPGIEEDFHVYGIDWTQDKIEFYIDDKLFYTFIPENKSVEVWPFDQPFYFLVNLAVGGHFGGQEIDDSVFPQKFVIDYIKVYQ